MVELRQDEGLYGSVTLRSTVPWCGVPQRGLCPHPQLLRGPGEGGRFALSLHLKAPFPAADIRAHRAGRSRAGRKQPASQSGAAEESTRLHKRCLVPPVRQSGSTSPPSPSMENPAPSAPLPPLTTFNLPIGYEMFSGERNLKFNTSHPGSTSAQLLVPLHQEWAKAPAVPGALRGCSRLAEATGS